MSDWLTDKSSMVITKELFERCRIGWPITSPAQKIRLIKDVRAILLEGARRAKKCPEMLPQESKTNDD